MSQTTRPDALKFSICDNRACLDVKLCSAWPLAPGKMGSGCVPLFCQQTPKRFLLPNYLPDSNEIWYGVSGNGASSCCAPLLDPLLQGVFGDNTHPQIRHVFKRFCQNVYAAECTEISTGYSATYPHVYLSTAWRLVRGKGAQGASSCFGLKTE